VSSDGSSVDFSYKKCLENFVKQKYPEHGESFCAKYFKKPRRNPPNADGSQPAETPTQPTDGQTPQLPETPSHVVADDWAKDAASHPVTDSWAKVDGEMLGSSEATPPLDDDWASK
jgi:hypothetical protein